MYICSELAEISLSLCLTVSSLLPTVTTCVVVLESGMSENMVKTRTHNPMLECLGPVVRSKTILVFVEVSSVCS